MQQSKALNMQAPAFMFFLLLCFASNNNMVRLVEAVWMTLPSSGTIKCVMEEIKDNVVVLGYYYALGLELYDDHANDTNSVPISVKVTSPFGDTLYHSEEVERGQFAFTTSRAGEYTACFWVDKKYQGNDSITLGLDWKIGIATKDWESVAKKEKIEGVELEVVKLTEVVKQMRIDLLHLRQRDHRMRKFNEKTNAKVVWFGIGSLGICIVTSVLQSLYLKRFFRKKKLI